MSTRVHPTTPTAPATEGRSIVVGVDTRGRSASAIVWAVEEAERDRSRLLLVTATRRPIDPHDPVGQHDLGALARRLSLMDVDQRSTEGHPVDVLLNAAVGATLLVVGCRTMRPSQRLVMGSTSRAVAAWSPVPAVIVPEAWMQPSMATAPVVVGVRPSEATAGGEGEPLDREVLDFAFNRAATLRVPLIVVSAYEPAWLQAWSPGDLDQARAAHDAALAKRLERWRDDYAGVEVVSNNVAEPADHALLEAARVAQLLVVGRHHSRFLSGQLGATARSVLRDATRPVAVIPSGTRDELVHELHQKQSRAEGPYAPTY